MAMAKVMPTNMGMAMGRMEDTVIIAMRARKKNKDSRVCLNSLRLVKSILVHHLILSRDEFNKAF